MASAKCNFFHLEKRNNDFNLSLGKIFVQLLEKCSSHSDCQAGLYCFSCAFSASRCVRYTATDEFKIVVCSIPSIIAKLIIECFYQLIVGLVYDLHIITYKLLFKIIFMFLGYVLIN